jgi:uncharacterized NAD(P)/FAD-binding protein YdhS
MRVAIVGAGFSGLALACQLVERRAALAQLTLIGNPLDFGRGRAYADTDPLHRLNVRASQMGLDAARPGEFADWLGLTGADRETYVARSRYGEYLLHRLQRARERAGFRFDCLPAQVPALGRVDGEFRVQLDPHAEVSTDRVVLALGSPIGADLSVRDPACIDDPWAPDALRSIAPEAEVLVIGTGLTCVDLLLSLRARGHRGRVHAMSRHGLLPRPHAHPHLGPGQVAPELAAAMASPRLRELVPMLRRACAQTADWRSVIDALRPQLSALWQSLSLVERGRFLRHLRSYWDVHRHRIPHDSQALLDAWQRQGGLRILAARLLGPVRRPDRLQVDLRRRGSHRIETLEVDHVIRATGLDTCIARSRDPLLLSLLEGGLISPDPLGLGLRCDRDFNVLDCKDRPVSGLHALGPLVRGRFWEMTAVAELRVAAATLAQRLCTEAAR